MDDIKALLTTTDGRIGRQQWWIGIVVLIVISIELMLNAVNINLVAAASHLAEQGPGKFLSFDGQIIAIFVITIAAAEIGLAFAIILRIYRNRGTVNVDEINLMKW